MISKNLLIHQSMMLQAPYVYPEINKFFVVAGYGCGKTSGQVDALLYAVQMLQGKKDKEGRNPKIGLFGVSITFMEKTILMNLEQTLRNTETQYRFDRKRNIITIGDVEILILSMEEPDKIYGFDVCCSSVDELDELPTNISIEAFKAINERTRQNVEGFRAPFILVTTTAQGIKGTYTICKTLEKAKLGHMIIRARTKDNIYLPKEYVDGLYAMYNEKETKCLLEGEFLSIDSGLVFPDYNPEVNKLDVDLYDCLDENATVYIGQDFNCIQEDVLIDTLKGKTKIKNIKVGDYVLTRKGYKKVLTIMCKGNNMVLDFNGVWATKDHIAITPYGDIEICKAKQFYYLPNANTKYMKSLIKNIKKLLKLKELCLTENIIIDTQRAKKILTIFNHILQQKHYCTEIYMNTLMEKLKKECQSTTKMDMMITDLNFLLKYLIKNTSKHIGKQMMQTTKRNYLNITIQLLVKKYTVLYLKKLGKKESTIAKLFVVIVGKYLQQELEQHKDAKLVKKNGIYIEKESVIMALKDIVLYVENILQEQVALHTAKNIKIIGKDQIIKKAKKAKVYDIEVEDAHEFFANGMLVHNCGFNNAVAFTVMEKSIIAVRDYELPDMRKAPEVFRMDFPTQKIVWIPDMTYKEHFGEFKKELKRFRINIAYRSCNPKVNDRIFACNKLFHIQRMFICPICKDLEQSLLTHQRDTKTGEPMKGGKGAPDHKSDCLGYVVHYLLGWCKELKDVYEFTLKRLYDKRRDNMYNNSKEELEIDTKVISSDDILEKEKFSSYDEL